MTKQELYNMLVRAKRPYDVFGDISQDELNNKFKKLAKLIHPDNAKENEKYISEQGFRILQTIYQIAKQEFEDGIYGVVSISELYKHQNSLFDLTIKGERYSFYECICNGEISDVYRGLHNNNVVCIKICLDPSDNELIKSEYETLMKFSHPSIPIVHEYLKVNDCGSVIMDNIDGETLPEIMDRNKRGIPAEHVMWIMERLFSVVGYLHSNCIIHGNIIPENVIINKSNHNVILTGFSFHIPEANKEGKHYQIANDKFSAGEVSNTSKVQPQSDIYSLGKLLIYMLGGSVISNGIPINVPVEIRNFAKKMVIDDVSNRPNDAWKLWDQWIILRKKLYGDSRFKKADF